MSDDTYSATEGLMNLIRNIHDGAAEGTGIALLVDFAKNLVGPTLPDELISYNIGVQNNLFGGYPDHRDYAPSIVFAVLFALFAICHTIILIINTTRGHHFYLSYVWIIFCIMKLIGFAGRARWSLDITWLSLGLTSEVFLIVSTFVIVSANLILAQRLFTWRHPVGGSRKLFWFIMIALYGFVCVIVAITIVASFVPYLYFLSESSYRSWIKTVQFTAVLIIAYCFTSVALIGLSFWLPTKKDESRYTYQPWWIESFAPFYFVEKGAAQKAEETFMKRNSNHRHATRVIAATHHHFKMVKGLSNKRGNLKHNISMAILIVTTILILFSSIVRTVVVFQAREHRDASAAESIWFGYVCWGIFESLISIIYIVGRVDLRFYRPDILPAKVRAIITAQQSYYPSDFEDEEDEPYKFDPPVFEETIEPPTEAHPYGQRIVNFTQDEEKAELNDSFDDIDSQEWDFADPRTNSTDSPTKWDKEKEGGQPNEVFAQSSRYIKQEDDYEFKF
ncbi:hypothetical protein Cantr_02856 [Candida viswanathii]|uniref:Uncharacterized protein n=1 Tax=Candida viswanathii TaxID=5486 RepID=A0A367YM46_9ASCO|nr:hypothetical protein Cantr_02856 [Candida viswanathii]